MLTTTTKAFRICLDGDWSMNGVAERFPLLAKQLSLLLGFSSGNNPQQQSLSAPPEIDLTEIQALDACGCQLLALFIRNLRQNGIVPLVTNIPDTFRAKISVLGFEREFNLSH